MPITMRRRDLTSPHCLISRIDNDLLMGRRIVTATAVIAMAALFPAHLSARGCRNHGYREYVDAAGCCDRDCEQTAHNPITQVYSLEVGGVTAYSSYLSPMRYRGWGLALTGEWSKNLKQNPEKVLMSFAAKVDCGSMLNPAKSAGMLGATAYFGWGLAAQWRPSCRWHLTLGGMLDLYGGALYLTRNGNNPVTPLAYTGIDLTASASYSFRLGRLPVVVRDVAKLPTAGTFFSPQYGETMYEIYLGNRKDLVHFGWWGNSFGIDNLLAFDLMFGKKFLRLGYRLDLRTFHAENLDSQIFRNSFTIAYGF